MRFRRTILILCLAGLPLVVGEEPTEVRKQICIVAPDDALYCNLEAMGGAAQELVPHAKGTIGVPYQWGGTRLDKGIDCSNYTWQLFRKMGKGYERFLSTQVLSALREKNGLKQVPFEDASPGDLLVYGYKDDRGHWKGHVVILVDRNGESTGHKGLALGAHGGGVDSVQFITFRGFEEGYYMYPKMRLRNVLRSAES